MCISTDILILIWYVFANCLLLNNDDHKILSTYANLIFILCEILSDEYFYHYSNNIVFFTFRLF